MLRITLYQVKTTAGGAKMFRYMNKKILVLLIPLIFLLGIFIFPQNAEAACTPRNMSPGMTCNTSQYNCVVGGGFGGIGTAYCCGQSTDCAALQNGTITSSNNTDPSLGCNNPGEVNTAIGCIPFQNKDVFVGYILKWALGIGGGIAFLLIVYSAFLIMTSTGDPERLKGGKDLMTSAISGLVLLILSVFVLQLIGVKILVIPGFGP